MSPTVMPRPLPKDHASLRSFSDIPEVKTRHPPSGGQLLRCPTVSTLNITHNPLLSVRTVFSLGRRRGSVDGRLESRAIFGSAGLQTDPLSARGVPGNIRASVPDEEQM